MPRYNWNCLKKVCHKIGLIEKWEFDTLVFYSGDTKVLTCLKSNRYNMIELNRILRKIDLTLEQFDTYLIKCEIINTQNQNNISN